MGLAPLSPVHRRPPEPDPLPLCVDVINGWPLASVWYIPNLTILGADCLLFRWYLFKETENTQLERV